MSMYRSYLLGKNFWARKGNERNDGTNQKKVFIKHSQNAGGIYAIVEPKGQRGVKIIANGQEKFFNNFDKLDRYLNKLERRENDFMKILRRKNISKKLRTLDI
jgi:sugar-specific transcriptional regulator TrmB